MSGDVHARFWESPGVRFPRATHYRGQCLRRAPGCVGSFDGAFFPIFRFVLEEIAVLLMMLSKVKLRSRRGRGCRTRRFSEQSRCGGSGRTEKSIKVSRRYDRGR